jgi:hypothetical protein
MMLGSGMVKRSASLAPWTVELADAELQFMKIGGGCKMRCVALFIRGQKALSDPTQMTPYAQGQRRVTEGEFAKCVQDHVMASLMRLEPSGASSVGCF